MRKFQVGLAARLVESRNACFATESAPVRTPSLRKTESPTESGFAASAVSRVT